MDPGPAPAVELSALTKTYGRHVAVNGVDLRIGQGESVGLVGPNGSGKSTTLKMLVGLVRPTSGTGRVLGRSITTDSVEVRRRVGYMPEEVHPYRGMTGRAYLGFCQSFHGDAGRDRAMALARRLLLPVDRRVKTYSLGMRVKLGLIQAIAHRPPVLILDEATKGLDPTSRREVLDLVREESERGTTVILSSHVLSEIERVCTRTEFIRSGRIVSAAERDEALGRIDRVARVAFFGDVEEERLRAIPGVDRVTREGAIFVLALTGDGRDALRALSDLPVRRLEFRSAGLDDLYAELYGAPGSGAFGKGDAT
jgi:ABC-2 type transport system ATP-binding protein